MLHKILSLPFFARKLGLMHVADKVTNVKIIIDSLFLSELHLASIVIVHCKTGNYETPWTHNKQQAAYFSFQWKFQCQFIPVGYRQQSLSLLLISQIFLKYNDTLVTYAIINEPNCWQTPKRGGSNWELYQFIYITVLFNLILSFTIIFIFSMNWCINCLLNLLKINVFTKQAKYRKGIIFNVVQSII